MPTIQTINESWLAGKIPNVLQIGVKSCDLNPTTEKEDSMQIAFGNLLNILIDRHLKLLYFKVPNRPVPADFWAPRYWACVKSLQH